ncbi:MAG: membrane protein insertion efficiency factor YidD [Leucobacter sp.]
MRPLAEIWLLPRNAAIACMQVYRSLVSPLYGQVCRYHPSCSRYALEAYQLRGFLVGTALTVWRLLRCNPFTPGGIDDVPVGRPQSFMINSRGFVRPIERKA